MTHNAEYAQDTFISVLRNGDRMNEAKSDVVNVYSAIATTSDDPYLNFGYWDENPNYANLHPSERLVVELIKNTELQDKKILDVGCGRGGTAKLIQQKYAVQEFVGVDLTPSFIQFCKKQSINPHFKFYVADAEDLIFADKSFDIVTNVESSHNYPSIDKFFQEVYRVLKPGGVFLYTDFCFNQWRTKFINNMQSLGFLLQLERNITKNVLAARRMRGSKDLQKFHTHFDTNEKKQNINEKLNVFWGKTPGELKDMLATEDSQFYRSMDIGLIDYMIYEFKK